MDAGSEFDLRGMGGASGPCHCGGVYLCVSLSGLLFCTCVTRCSGHHVSKTGTMNLRALAVGCGVSITSDSCMS